MEIINTIKNYHWLLTVVGGVFIAVISTTWLLSAKYNDFNKETEELLKTVKTTQQMALKSVIWNDEIPLTERASACDVYLAAGYNSMTKRECETIIEKASEQGVF